jgi:predicted membrane-bound dolichyl-phosphate-mannose-protein mannosyltransferase
LKPALFLILLVWVAHKIVKEPIWATMAAVFVYYCIPMREFMAPSAPYLAGFFALSVILLGRNRTAIAERAQKEIEEKAVAAADAAAHGVARRPSRASRKRCWRAARSTRPSAASSSS